MLILPNRRDGNMKAALLLITIILLLSCSKNETPKTEEKTAESNHITPLPPPVERDFEAIKKDGVLKVLTIYSQTSYFLYKGKTMGFEYELFNSIANSLGLKLEIVVVADIDEIFAKLNRGEGDIAGYGLTITKDRREHVLFTDYLMLVKQVVVQKLPTDWRSEPVHRTEKKLVRNAVQLIGKPVYIRKNSSYNLRLQNLSNEIGDDIDIHYVDGAMSTDQIIRNVNKGEFEYTIADENIAMVNKTYLPNIDIETAISSSQRIAWAVRKNSPLLVEALNKELTELKKKPDFNMIYNKYFKSPKALIDRHNSDEYIVKGKGKLSEYDAIIKEVSKRYNYNWRLIASIIYQESQFDPKAKSWMGAQGLMQIMPETAKELGIVNVLDPKDNITNGVKYIHQLEEYWKTILPDSTEAFKFALASYNVGKGHVIDARTIAETFGKNHNLWFNETEKALLLLEDKKYYSMNFVKFGYCRGTEPYNYVNEIYDRFNQYSGFIK